MKLHIVTSLIAVAFMATVASAASDNGRAGTMPTYYDGQLFTINFKEMPDDAADALAHNQSVNFIFVSDEALPDGSPFVSVIDAIQGDGFNPLWIELEIEFTEGHAARQLTSDDDVGDALMNGEITLNASGEIYRCAVIGPKTK